MNLATDERYVRMPAGSSHGVVVYRIMSAGQASGEHRPWYWQCCDCGVFTRCASEDAAVAAGDAHACPAEDIR